MNPVLGVVLIVAALVSTLVFARLHVDGGAIIATVLAVGVSLVQSVAHVNALQEKAHAMALASQAQQHAAALQAQATANALALAAAKAPVGPPPLPGAA